MNSREKIIRIQKKSILLNESDRKISLNNIININELQNVQDSVSEATNIASIIIDRNGNPVTAPSNYTRLFKDIINKNGNYKNDYMLSVFPRRPESGAPVLIRGNNAIMWYGCVNIIMFNQHVADWIIGQVTVDRVNKNKLTAYIKKIGTDEGYFLSAFREIPQMTKKQFANIAKFVKLTANNLAHLVSKDKEYYRNNNTVNLAKDKIDKNEKLYLSLFNEIQYGLALHEMIYDNNKKPVDFILLDANPAYEKIVKMERKDIIGKKASEILPKIDKGWIKKLSNVALTGKPLHNEDYFPGLDRYYDVMIFSPKKKHFAILMTDITEQKNTEKKLQRQYEEIHIQNKMLAVTNEEFESVNKELLNAHNELMKSKEKFQVLYNNALVAMVSMDIETGMVIEANDLAYKIFGYSSKEEIIGKQNGLERFVDPAMGTKFFKDLLEKGELHNIEAELIRNDGTTFWGEITCKLYPEEKIVGGIFLDVTRRKAAEEKITRLTFYDRLTELPNKGMLKNIIYQEIEKTNEFALICLGIDKFKVINDLFGPETGDFLLKQVASRLNDMYFKKDFVCRFEGDKFMILLMDIANINRDIEIEDIEKIIQKTLKAFSVPIIMDSYTLDIRSSIGVSLYPTDGDNPDSLMQNSESAMNVAKQRGGDTWHFFDAKLNEQMMNRFRLENELKAAIKNNEFVVFYQPKVDREGNIIGAEALIRWFSPRRGGYILPFEFIPVVEKNGMIVDIGYSILKKTCEQNKKWQDMGLGHFPVSVNLSPYQFKQRDLISNIRNIIFETGLDPKWLELEITETGIMENESDAIEKLNEIHGLGITISIDDFGTGYSSLSKLKSYPVDILKIDKTFIDDLPKDNLSATITTTIIDLAHNLGFNVVAEGVERVEQLNFLTEHKCDQFQGYYFYKPIPPEELEKHLKDNSPSFSTD